MDSQLLRVSSYKKGLILDPRTKMFLLFTTSTLMLSTGNDGVMLFVKPLLTFLPCVFFLSAKRFKDTLIYIILYAIFFLLELYLLKQDSGIFNLLLLVTCSIMTRFAPSIMAGYFLMSTTSVSEFIGAMKRMRITDKIIIPMSVIFRFFPTIKEESVSINEAMKMRGIQFKTPIAMVEYRLIPLMLSTLKIGEELSCSALTRGLGSPKKRTSICDIGFNSQDFFMAVPCIFCFVLYIFRNQIVF